MLSYWDWKESFYICETEKYKPLKLTSVYASLIYIPQVALDVPSVPVKSLKKLP